MTDQKDRPGSDDDMGLTAEDMELTFEEGAQEMALDSDEAEEAAGEPDED